MKLYLVVKIALENSEFLGCSFFDSLLKLRNKDKNGIMYVHKYIENNMTMQTNLNVWWRVKGIQDYNIL
jgi:hypothetical protein